jgi:hypothetical protein
LFVKPPQGFGPDVASVDGLSMMVFKDVENVTVSGQGATIRMRKSDYNSMAVYKPPSSDRMGLLLRNCTDITIRGLVVEETGGDGIYIGRNHFALSPNCTNQSTACHGVARNIHIADVKSVRNSRQGMSIVAGIDVLVENSEFSWTEGACPQAGIDIEPSSAAEPLHNITLRNLLIENNTGAALQVPVDPYTYMPGNLTLLLTFDNIHVRGANWSAVNDGCSSSGLGIVLGPTKSIGSITMSNCVVEQLPSTGLLVQAKAYDTADIKGSVGPRGAWVRACELNVFNCSFIDTALRPDHVDGMIESPVTLAALAAPFNWTTGNIRLDGLTVSDRMRRPWLSVSQLGPYSVRGPVEGIEGTAIVSNPTGCSIGGEAVNVSMKCVSGKTGGRETPSTL